MNARTKSTERPASLRILLSREEREHLGQLAGDEGVSMATWLRTAIRKAFQRREADRDRNEPIAEIRPVGGRRDA